MKTKNGLALTSIAILIIAAILYKWPRKTDSEPQPVLQKQEYSREVLPKKTEKFDENDITNMENLTGSTSGIILPKDLKEE